MPGMALISRQQLLHWRDNLEETVKHRDLSHDGPVMRWAVRMLRVIVAIMLDLGRGQLTLWAMSLVYTTLLSLVPLLAISFSILKGFGVHNQIEPVLLGLLEPLGDDGVEITAQIIAFVDNMKVGVLGSLGFALLFYTVVSLMQKIERAFNHIWRTTRERSLSERFRDYLFVLTLGPAVVFVAIGITASAMSAPLIAQAMDHEAIGIVVKFVGRLVPFLMIVAAFTFMYIFIPNTKVKKPAALAGGLVAGLLWNLTGWLFASFVVGSGKYTAIYSTFATLILFMIWLYLAWLILLTGAKISYYVQNPSSLRSDAFGVPFAHRARERIALAAAALIAQAYYRGHGCWTLSQLSRRLAVQIDPLQHLLSDLQQAGLVHQTADDPPGYLPARPPEETTAAEVLEAVRGGKPDQVRNAGRLRPLDALDGLVDEADAAMRERLSAVTLRDLALRLDDQPMQPGLEHDVDASWSGEEAEIAAESTNDDSGDTPIRPVDPGRAQAI